MIRHVAVIGGGATGTLVALHLLRAGASKVSLIERSPEAGRGLAYGTARPEHLLNVPAAKMSAFADAPDHFAAWYGKRGAAPGDFAPRHVYGDYLQSLLADAGTGLSRVADEAIDVTADAENEQVHLASGDAIHADHVVLAPGNLPPGPIRADVSPALFGDPWSSSLAEGLGSDDLVLLIGTGLTAVDAVLTLDAAGFRGSILALSRRGLRPRGHEAGAAPPAPPEQLPGELSQLSRAVRSDCDALGWQAAVDRLRPVTQQLWAQAGATERGRFLRHLRPYWDVHRHRIAPQVSARLDALCAEGRLRIAGGRIQSLTQHGESAQLVWRPRGQDVVRTETVARIVNCTGPGLDVARSGDRLLTRLLRSGRIRQDALKIGLDVDAEGRLIDGAGSVSASLTAAGPVTRSALWEIVAVPDIRVQAAALAGRLLA